MRHRVAALCVLAATALLGGAFAGEAAYGATGGLPGTGDKSFSPGHVDNHCVMPWGVDVNQVMGVSERILLGDWCETVPVGEFWIPLGVVYWIANSSFEVVPDGYVPSAATPMQDFLSKIKTVTYVIDPTTRQEKTLRYRAKDVVKVVQSEELLPGWFPQPVPVASFLAKLPPLSAGPHRYIAAFELSARTCDGLGTTEGSNCIGPGEFWVCPGLIPFDVTPKAATKS